MWYFKNLIFMILIVLFSGIYGQTDFFIKGAGNENRKFYKDFLVKLDAEETFESCLIYGDMRRNQHLEVFLKIIVEDMQKPMLLHNVAPGYEVVKIFNRNILTIAVVVNLDTELDVLAETLNLMLQKRVILICEEEQTARERESYLTRLFRLCEMRKMLNVIVIFSDFSGSNIFYSYTIFPTFHVERKTYATAGVVVFPHRMSDLHGYGIRTMPDQLFPFSYANNIDGRVKASGLLPVLLEIFAASINATLTYPMPVIVGESHCQTDFAEMLKRNVLDIPAARMEILDSFDETTLPYAIGDICIITPAQRYHSFLKFYYIYTSRTHFIVELLYAMAKYALLHFIHRLQFFRVDKVFHYNLLTSCTEPNYISNHLTAVHTARLPRLISLRIMTILTLISSLCIFTQFTAILNSFITKPVLVASPKTWQDFNENGYKILLSTAAYKYISTYCGELCEDMEKAVRYVETSKEMTYNFNRLDTRYAYMIDTFAWDYIKLQMETMGEIIFTLSNICVRTHIFHAVQLHPNSIFKDSLNIFLARAFEHGLQKASIDFSFLAALKAGKINYTYYRGAHINRPLDMAFVSFMWPIFGCVWTLSFLIFTFEVFKGNRQKITQRKLNWKLSIK